MRKLLLTLIALLALGVSGAWAETTPTFSAIETPKLVDGWYQIKWFDTANESNIGYTSNDVEEKYVTNYTQDVTVNGNCYALYIDNAPSTLDQHTKTFVYLGNTTEAKNGDAIVGKWGYLRSANGHYITQTGVSSLSASSQNCIIYYGSGNKTQAVITTKTKDADRYSLVPIKDGEKSYIGRTPNTNKFPRSYFSPVNLSSLGLQPWTISIVGLSETIASDNTQVTYSGSSVYGLTSVYNNGTFFIANNVTPLASDFSVSQVDGVTPSITVDTDNYTIIVKYTVNVTYNLYESDGQTLVTSAVVVQNNNSDVCIPNSLKNVSSSYEATDYNYSTTGTIGFEDCTITVTRTLKTDTYTTSFDNGSYISIGTAVTSFTAASSANDNDHWYLITQNRGGTETPIYDVNTYSNIYRAGTSVTIASLNDTPLSGNEKYLVRFIETGENTGLYYMQFANGNYIAPASTARTNSTKLVTVQTINSAGTFAFYTYPSESSTFGWNIDSNSPTSMTVDNDGAGASVLLYGTGNTPTGSKLWTIYNVSLSVPSCFVQYEISDASGVVFTSPSIPTSRNDVINTMPNIYKRSFCSYNVTSTTVTSEGVTTVPVTVTYNTPFTISPDYANASWYYLKLKDESYVTYYADASPNVALPTSTFGKENALWAFIGNPYSGFQIVNKAAGSSLVLGSASASGDGNTGANTYATLGTGQTYEYWFPSSSSHYTNGFYLANAEGHALNKRSTSNLAYWTNSSAFNNDGSTFTVEAPVTLSYTLIDMNSAEYSGTYTGKAGATLPSIFGCYGYSLSNEEWNGNEYIANIEFEFSVSSNNINNATTLMSKLGSSLWYAANDQAKARRQTKTKVYDTYADNYRWYIYPSINEGKFTFKLYNVGAGKYIPKNPSTASGTATTLVSGAENAGSFCYSNYKQGNGFNTTADNSTTFLTINSDGGNDGTIQNIWLWNGGDASTTHTGSAMSFPELTVINVDETFATLKNADKFDILEGSTVQGPSEFAAPEEINAAIDAAQSVAENSVAKIEFIESENGSKIQTYLDQVAKYGDLANIQFTMSKEYGTLILPCPSTRISGLDIYSCSAQESGVLTLTPVDGNYVYNKPYIIHAVEGSKYTIIGWDKGSTETHTDGWLTGVLNSSTEIPSGSYMLATNKTTNKQAFYQVSGSGVMCAKNKCYLTVPEPSSVKAFYFPDSDLTVSVDEIFAGKSEHDSIYNLSGQRLSKAQKGINIINGKKILK